MGHITITETFSFMKELIDKGVEYPEAEWKAVIYHFKGNLPESDKVERLGKKLRQIYDRQTEA